MKFQAKGGSDFKIPPAGNHVAICNMVVDLGIQPGRGQFPEPRPEVYIRFELPNEQHTYKDKEGREVTAPMVIGQTFTASMSTKANLRKFIESWRGENFAKDEEAAAYDFVKLPGKKCLLNVIHVERSGKTYANIKSATPMPKGMTDASKQHNPTVYFSLEAPVDKDFDKVPQWLQKKIRERIPEDKAIDSGVSVPEGADDDIPF
jgi:hypothetical protein